jgi:hypothetical protein
MIEQGYGYNTQDTLDNIAQLEKVTASDRGTVAKLTATTAKIASQMEAEHLYIKMLKDEILAFKVKIKPTWQGQLPAKSTNNNNCFWSHGHQVHKDHTSTTCKARKEGHQEMVIKNNTMGGVRGS